MKQRVLAAALFVALPVGCYLLGKRSASHEPAPRAQASVALASSPRLRGLSELRVEDVAQMDFVDVYRSLEACNGDCRSNAVEKLREIGGRRERRAATTSMFKCLAMLDLDSAIRLLPQIEDEEDRMTAVVAVINAAPSMLTPKLVRMLLDLPGEFGERARDNQLLGQLSVWSAVDPAAAAQFFDAHPPLLSEASAVELISNWAARDPNAAQAWLSRHAEVGAGAKIVEALVHGLYQNDPDTARRYVLSNVADERFAPLISTLTAITLMTSLADAADFVRALPDAPARAEALRAAAERMSELLPAPDIKGVKDHQELAEWLLTFSAPERTGSIENVLRKWQGAERDRPFQWLRELPLEKQREVFAGFAVEVSEVSLRAALAVQDVPLREQLLRRFSADVEEYSPSALLALGEEFTPEEMNVLADWMRKAEPQPSPAR